MEKNWVEVDEYLDDGGWRRSTRRMWRSARPYNNLGRPVATFRRDNARDVDFKNLNVREIML